MGIRELLRIWEQESSTPVSPQEYRLRLPIYDAAKIAALCEIYPGRTEEQIIAELIHAALHELVALLPYRAGEQVQMIDEQGDAVYEDIGLSRRLHDLTDKHLQRIRENS